MPSRCHRTFLYAQPLSLRLYPQSTCLFDLVMFPFGFFTGIVRPFRGAKPPIEDSDDEMVGVLKEITCFCSYDISNGSYQQRTKPCL